MSSRDTDAIDNLIVNIDQAVRTLFGRPKITERSNPANGLPETELNDAERDHIARLMRINHTGEVCAQALYQGQALTARLPEVKHAMERSAAEENDHLDWCEQRVEELGGHTSLLNPLFYAGSFALGAAAGLVGRQMEPGFRLRDRDPGGGPPRRTSGAGPGTRSQDPDHPRADEGRRDRVTARRPGPMGASRCHCRFAWPCS